MDEQRETDQASAGGKHSYPKTLTVESKLPQLDRVLSEFLRQAQRDDQVFSYPFIAERHRPATRGSGGQRANHRSYWTHTGNGTRPDATLALPINRDYLPNLRRYETHLPRVYIAAIGTIDR